jgi:glycosyltransferase involved in cell wall biosynthesis
LKIGIIGIRGIPNRHGGFEQFTELVAPALVKLGHTVYVYNSSLHPYQEASWNGVHIIKKFDPEDKIGTAGQFIYDFNCIRDSRKQKFDIILQLGYTSSSVWSFLYPKYSVLVTNMDGLEWKRSKYTKRVQQFLKRAERWAVVSSQHLIADSKGIQKYLSEKYNRSSSYIAYGANMFRNPSADILRQFDLLPFSYNLVIARMEPENNIETIIKGHIQSETLKKLVIIGDYKNKFGTYLKNQYRDENIQFRGASYDSTLLNNLRYYSQLYFHGHSVGGTNPSLLEAMASNALIVAHDNIFNRGVLEDDAFYFSSSDEIAGLLKQTINKKDFQNFLQSNCSRIERNYSWDHITNQLESLFIKLLHGNIE